MMQSRHQQCVKLLTKKGKKKQGGGIILVAVTQTVPSTNGSNTTTPVPVHDVAASTVTAIRRGTDLGDAFHGVHAAGLAETGDVARVAHVAVSITVGGSKDVGWGRRRTRRAVLSSLGLGCWARAGARGTGTRRRSWAAGARGTVLRGTSGAGARRVLVGVRVERGIGVGTVVRVVA